MSDSAERRTAPRVPRMERLFIRTIDDTTDPPILGTVVHCISEDLSSGGMRLRIDQAFEPGVKLQLWIKLYGRAGTYLLEGVVRWQQHDSAQDKRQIGIELTRRDAELEEMWQGWEEVVAEITD